MHFTKLAKSAWLVAATALALVALAPGYAPLIGAVAAIVLLLLLVARFDNRSGAFLPLAALLVVVLLVLLFLVVGLAVIHRLMAGGG